MNMRQMVRGVMIAVGVFFLSAAPHAASAPQCAGLRGPQWMECRFELGMRAKARRGWRESIRHFRDMLARDPNLPRVRLELAQSYFMAGNDTQAEYHFRQALGGGLPPVVQRKVLAYIDAMRRRKTWSLSVDFAAVPQSNINKATSARTVMVAGLPMTLTDDSRKTPGWSVKAAGDFVWRPYVAEDIRGHVRLAPSVTATMKGKTLPDPSDFSLSRSWIVLNGEAGLVFLSDNQEISAGVAAGRIWNAGDGYRWHVGGWLRGQRELDALTRISASAELLRLKYDTALEKKGWELSLAPAVRRQLSPIMALNLSAPFTWLKVKEKDRSRVSMGLNAELNIILPADFTLNISGGVSRSRYRGVDEVFGKRRKDWLMNASARVTWGKLSAFDLAPYAQYSYERRDSTLKLHDYDNHAFTIGVSKTF